jgi:hypothetical protein
MKRVVTLAAIFLLAAAPLERPSTVAQRQRINVTVYNGGTALIHDRRRMTLAAGINRVAWRDVSAGMDPTSALLEAIGSPNKVTVVEQNFDFDLLNPDALLQKYVGQYVTVVHEARFTGEHDTRERARILSTNGGIVLQYRDRIETSVRGHIIFPSSPKNFRDRPTLLLDFASERSGPQLLDLSYLTGGMSWRADYVGVLAPDNAHLSITGLVTLSNMSGASYENAHLQLVAGNVNIVNPPMLSAAMSNLVRPGTTADTYSVGNVGQENYFEYHLYTLRRPSTILDKQTKQLTLLSAHNVPVRKTLELRGSPDYYRSVEPDLGDRLPIAVYVTFRNRGGDLGIPLPAGIFRIYQTDSRKISQFLGSDNIDHTPKNETVRLHLGDSFDVTARKKQTDFHFVTFCTASSSYEIALSNAKTVAQDVLVVEPIPGDWQITGENFPHTKSSSSTANWVVRVPADGRTVLNYTAQTSWCK